VLVSTEQRLRDNRLVKGQMQGFDRVSRHLRRLLLDAETPYDVLTNAYGMPGQSLRDLLNLSGVQLYDWRKDRNNVYSEDFKQVLQLYKELGAANLQWAAKTGDEAFMDNFWTSTRWASFENTMIFKNMSDSDLTDLMRALCTYGENASPVVMPFTNIKGGVTARVWYCAAISKTAKNKKGALEFLQYFYDDTYIINRDMWLPGFPVATKFLTKQIAEATSSASNAINWMREGDFYYRYNDYAIRQLMTLAENVGQIKFPDLASDDKMDKAIEAYVKGDITLDDCLKTVYRRVEIYAKG